MSLQSQAFDCQVLCCHVIGEAGGGSTQRHVDYKTRFTVRQHGTDGLSIGTAAICGINAIYSKHPELYIRICVISC